MKLKVNAKLDTQFEPLSLVCRDMREATKEDGQDIIIAVPEGYALGEVKDEDGDFAKAFKALDDVVVKCAGTATKTYKVYRFDNGTPYPMEILSITIKKA